MKILSLFVPLIALGCAQARLFEPVTVVTTRTPGVSFVVVRPLVQQGRGTARQQPGDGKQVDANSWYILMCDARPADGMHCVVPTEASLARYSYTPITGNAAAPIDEGVGTLADISTNISKEKDKDDASSSVPPSSAPAAPLPPPPPAPLPAGKDMRP
jgi:hypothetical protein